MRPNICQIAIPSANDIPLSWVAEQTGEILRQDSIETLGSEDFFVPIAARVPLFRDESDYWTVALVAVRGVDVGSLPHSEHGLPILSWDAREAGAPGEVLATASMDGDVHDNQHAVELGIIVRADQRRHGLGRAMQAELERIARERGRDTMIGWCDHPQPAAGVPTITPPSGCGRIAVDDPYARFAQAMGYELQLCEQHSVQELSGIRPLLDRLEADALPHAGDYEIRAFTGPAPDDLAESLCRLLTHFSEEIPNGGLDVEAERWDVERLRRGEARREAAGKVAFATLAVHRATGEVVAQTDVTTLRDRPACADQNTTIVRDEHRGHRLGMLVKIANARQILASGLGVERIQTWNADENDHMLAINRRLGYVPRVVEGAWQKKLA